MCSLLWNTCIFIMHMRLSFYSQSNVYRIHDVHQHTGIPFSIHFERAYKYYNLRLNFICKGCLSSTHSMNASLIRVTGNFLCTFVKRSLFQVHVLLHWISGVVQFLVLKVPRIFTPFKFWRKWLYCHLICYILFSPGKCRAFYKLFNNAH